MAEERPTAGQQGSADYEVMLSALTERFVGGADVPLDVRATVAARAAATASEMYRQTTGSGDVAGLSATARLWQRILAATPIDGPDRPGYLLVLSATLRSRSILAGDPADLDAAIAIGRDAIGTATGDDHRQPTLLAHLAETLMTRHDRTGAAADLDEALGDMGRALAATPEAHPNRAPYLSLYGTILRVRFIQRGDGSDLDAAIDACAKAVLLADDSARPGMLYQLGVVLTVRFGRTSRRGDIDAAIDAFRAAAESTPQSSLVLANRLSSFATALRQRFMYSGAPGDLEEAISAGRRAVEVASQDYSDWAACLSSLGTALMTRAMYRNSPGDMDEATAILRQVLELLPSGHPARPEALSDLSATLRARFRATGELADLMAAVASIREAVDAAPAGHTQRGLSLLNLCAALSDRYGLTENPADAAEAVEVGRRMLAEIPDGHSAQAMACYIFGNALLARSNLEPGDDLDAAIGAYQQAVALAADGSPALAGFRAHLGSTLRLRFELTGHQGDLDEAIAACRQAVEGARDGADGGNALFNLGLTLLTRYEQSSAPDDLASAITALRQAVEAEPAGRGDQSLYQTELGRALRLRFQLTGQRSDVAEAVTLGRQAAETAPAGDRGLRFYRLALGEALWEQAGYAETAPLTTRSDLAAVLAKLVDDVRDPEPHAVLAPAALDAARRLAGMLSADESPDLDVLALLGRFHWLRWNAGPDDADDPGDDALDEAVRAYLPVFLAGRDVPARLREVVAVSVLDDAVEEMFGRVLLSGDIDLLHDALAKWRRISDSLPKDHPQQGICMGIIGMGLRAECALIGSRATLDDSIIYLQEAMETASADEPLRSAFQAALSESLRGRFLLSGDPADLGRAIEEALGAIECCAGAPDADALHGTLGMALLNRFELADGAADLEAAIVSLSRASTSDMVTGPFRGLFLSQMCRALRLKAEVSGDTTLLDRAVGLGTEAVGLIPAGHSDQIIAVTELGLALMGQADRGGGHANLDAAVDLLTRVLDETASGHPSYALLLGSLAAARMARATATGSRADLDAATDSAERAVATMPADHPARAAWLCILGQSLLTRYASAGSGADIDAAVTAYREAVNTPGSGGHDRSFYLWGCSLALLTKFERSGGLGYLDESIGMARQSRGGIPDGHPDRALYLFCLGIGLRERCLLTGDFSEFNKAVSLIQQAVHSAPASNSVRSWMLQQLGSTLDARYRHFHDKADRDGAIAALRQSIAIADIAAIEPHSMMLLAHMLSDASNDMESTAQRDEAVALYTDVANSSAASYGTRISAARLAAHLIGASAPGQAADLLETAVRLVPQAASRQLRRTDQQHALSRFANLASEACEAVLTVGGPDAAARALGLLELGRAVIQGQALDSRSDILALHVARPDLASEFLRLCDLLDNPDDPVPASLLPTTAGSAVAAARAADRIRAGGKFAELVDRIRRLDGFESFLLPPAPDDLTSHADRGSVIVFNVGHSRGDALVISTTGISQVPLPGLVTDVVLEKTRAWEEALRNTFLWTVGTVPRASAEDALGEILEWLWDAAAEPVLRHLGCLGPPAAGQQVPHVWWVSGGLLSMLPLHAAGRHRAGAGDTVLDRVISSHTPTVRALAYARERARSTPPSRTLIVAMPSTPGLAPLPDARAEATTLAGMLPSPTLLVEEANASNERTPTRDAVISQLADAGIAHFSCHAASHPDDPSRSQIYLHDHRENPFTVATLIPVHLQHAQLAFLSACQTARSEAMRLIDEGLHLASAFQLAGFPHVIGTLWPVYDNIATEIAVTFYTRLHAGLGVLDVNTSAQALHEAVCQQRSKLDHSAYPSLWAAYAHVGA